MKEVLDKLEQLEKRIKNIEFDLLFKGMRKQLVGSINTFVYGMPDKVYTWNGETYYVYEEDLEKIEEFWGK